MMWCGLLRRERSSQRLFVLIYEIYSFRFFFIMAHITQPSSLGCFIIVSWAFWRLRPSMRGSTRTWKPADSNRKKSRFYMFCLNYFQAADDFHSSSLKCHTYRNDELGPRFHSLLRWWVSESRLGIHFFNFQFVRRKSHDCCRDCPHRRLHLYAMNFSHRRSFENKTHFNYSRQSDRRDRDKIKVGWVDERPEPELGNWR